MAAPVYVLTVNSVVTPHLRLGFEIREVANGRNRITLKIFAPTGTPPVVLGDTITLTEDGTPIFGGTVEAAQEAGAGGQPVTATEWTIDAPDFNALTERRVVNLGFTGTLKSVAILADRLRQYRAGDARPGNQWTDMPVRRPSGGSMTSSINWQRSQSGYRTSVARGSACARRPTSRRPSPSPTGPDSPSAISR